MPRKPDGKSAEQLEKEREARKAKLILKYAQFVEKKGRHPAISDLIPYGYGKDFVARAFGNFKGLQKAARAEYPKAFANIIDEALFTPKAFKKLREKAGNYVRYFVSTAVTGCRVFDGFMDAIKSYNRKNRSLLLVMPATDPAATAGFTLDPSLPKDQIIFADLQVNDNLFLSSIKLSAKHIDPITGLNRIGQRNGSFIYASPKQRLKMTPTSNEKLPHAMMTTGALTLPDYATTRYMSERTAYIADNDHVLGGVVVEVQDDNVFHFRQVQADRHGSFIDLGKLYKADGSVETVRPAALILGDWHSGETDPVAREAFVGKTGSVLTTTQPRAIVVHDGFNGRSISHHEEKNRILRAQRARRCELSLEEELIGYARDLEYLASFPFIEEVVIVLSNHDEFLHRYLSEGRYVEDAQNHRLGLKLAAAMVDGKNPVQAFIERIKIKNAEKLRWLTRDEDYKVAEVEIGAHGDKGPNGARGSVRAMENAYGNSVSGHAHTPEILRGAWQVGTCSLLKLTYNEGPSSWLHTSCLLYPNGSRQLINVIEGNWRLQE